MLQGLIVKYYRFAAFFAHHIVLVAGEIVTQFVERFEAAGHFARDFVSGKKFQGAVDAADIGGFDSTDHFSRQQGSAGSAQHVENFAAGWGYFQPVAVQRVDKLIL
jgi:hypothetical protein